MNMDDERIERDAERAIAFLEFSERDLENPDFAPTVSSCRFQACCFLANYFSRANAPLIAAATAVNIAATQSAPKPGS